MTSATAPSTEAKPSPSAEHGPGRPQVTVCICTFRRPALLRTLLDSVADQRTEGAFTFSIVVADNDAARSAEPVVAAFRAHASVPIAYCVEPVQNIALTRNRALSHATGDYIAFIDDDECPVPDWLRLMLATCERTHAAGVLGPVRPRFEAPPPAWVIRGRFCERPEHPTGTVIPWNKSRTGNLLFRRSILDGTTEPFRPAFGTGGEDVDFFQRMSANGCKFMWCNEAPAYESVPPSRCTRKYMFTRAFLRGRNALRVGGTPAVLLTRSLAAIPIYSLCLPVLAFTSQRWFMHYAIRWCDHVGRLLTAMRLNPITERSN